MLQWPLQLMCFKAWWRQLGIPLTVTAIGMPAAGTAVINSNQTVTYSPDSGTTAKTDAFAYTVSDGNGHFATGTVSVFLTDRIPVANKTILPHATAAVTANVLDNDWDPDSD